MELSQLSPLPPLNPRARSRSPSSPACACLSTRAVLRKNAVLSGRNTRDLFREIGLPLLLLGVLIALNRVSPPQFISAVVAPPLCALASLDEAAASLDRRAVWVAPCGPRGDARVSLLAAALAAAAPGVNVSCFPGEADMLAAYSATGGAGILAGVVFSPPLALPLTYTLRLDAAHGPSTARVLERAVDFLGSRCQVPRTGGFGGGLC